MEIVTPRTLTVQQLAARQHDIQSVHLVGAPSSWLVVIWMYRDEARTDM